MKRKPIVLALAAGAVLGGLIATGNLSVSRLESRVKGPDNPRNQDGIGEKELLVVSFGTSYPDTRRQTIGAIEDALARAFPDWSVRRAFTSGMILDRIKEKEGVTIDRVEEALKRAAANGVKTLAVQPTHLMSGREYAELTDEVARYAERFEQVTVGEPLLHDADDFLAVMDAITTSTMEYDDGETAVCFMGHGTEAEANSVYARMQGVLTGAGYLDCYVGTVEASPSLDDVLAEIQAGDYRRVVLQPLMIVAGDHANRDMAGDQEGSWKRVFQAAGYEVECVLCGLGEMRPIQKQFIAHARAAMAALEQPK